MVKRVLIGAGLFMLGYALGKAVGRAEAELNGRLGWEGNPEPPSVAEQSGEDADFEDPAPDVAPTDLHAV